MLRKNYRYLASTYLYLLMSLKKAQMVCSHCNIILHKEAPGVEGFSHNFPNWAMIKRKGDHSESTSSPSAYPLRFCSRYLDTTITFSYNASQKTFCSHTQIILSGSEMSNYLSGKHSRLYQCKYCPLAQYQSEGGTTCLSNICGKWGSMCK